jgi:hypothetical protein
VCALPFTSTQRLADDEDAIDLGSICRRRLFARSISPVSLLQKRNSWPAKTLASRRFFWR